MPRPSLLCVPARLRSLPLLAVLASNPAFAADGPAVAGIPVDFILFALTLLGVALFHHHTLKVALVGLGTITAFKLAFTGFRHGDGLAGLASHLGHEWVILANLLLLLLGFGLLAQHFEKSEIPLVFAVNKSESRQAQATVPEFAELGFEPLAISALEGSGLDELRRRIVWGLPPGAFSI